MRESRNLHESFPKNTSKVQCNFLPTSKSYTILVLQDVFVWKQVRCAPSPKTLPSSKLISKKLKNCWKLCSFHAWLIGLSNLKQTFFRHIFFSFMVPIFYFLLDSHISANNSLHSDALIISYFSVHFFDCVLIISFTKNYFSNAFLILIS